MKTPIVIFDIGGTLMEGPVTSPTSRFIKELGLKNEDKHLISSFLFTNEITNPEVLSERFASVFPYLKKEDHETIKHIWKTQLSEGYPLPGAFELLRHLINSGCRLGIISNIWHPYYLCFQNIFNEFIPNFEVMTLSYISGIEKPDLSLFKNTYETFQQRSKEAVDYQDFCMVGDSYYHDVAPAHEIGFKTLWILEKPSREIQYLEGLSEKKLKHPNYIISDIEYLAEDNFKMLDTMLGII
jgi:FMN phosphatase YigB (HAD superfamily)